MTGGRLRLAWITQSTWELLIHFPTPTVLFLVCPSFPPSYVVNMLWCRQNPNGLDILRHRQGAKAAVSVAMSTVSNRCAESFLVAVVPSLLMRILKRNTHPTFSFLVVNCNKTSSNVGFIHRGASLPRFFLCENARKLFIAPSSSSRRVSLISPIITRINL